MASQRLTKVTIKDIARACNVSTQTVSRVLNNRPDVAPQTREAVEQAIANLGYQPSAVARSLVQQQSNTLGVIVAGLRYIGVSQTLNGITEQCEAFGYALMLKELPRFDVPDIVPIITALIAHQVEGIIFAAPELNDNIQRVQAQLPPACPPIIFLKSQPHPAYMTINIDNYQGAKQAVEHLFTLGRQHVGLISGPLEWIEARQRWQAWVDLRQQRGEPISNAYWGEGNWSAASGEAACARLIASYPELDALFVSNDQMALGALHYAYQHGLRVPEDLAIIGFDDLAEAAYFAPALSSVRQPLRELGVLAVKTLIASLTESDALPPHKTITLMPELILRESAPAVPRLTLI